MPLSNKDEIEVLHILTLESEICSGAVLAGVCMQFEEFVIQCIQKWVPESGHHYGSGQVISN